MKPKIASVDEYFANLNDENREYLGKLRDICLKILTDFEESIINDYPVYINFERRFAFHAQKKHINLYFDNDEYIFDLSDILGDYAIAKTCIRYRRASEIPLDGFEALLRRTYTDKNEENII
jgi:hypothetical protein